MAEAAANSRQPSVSRLIDVRTKLFPFTFFIFSLPFLLAFTFG
jgi:hypothetical protein